MNDPQDPATDYIDTNNVTFHDGRAIQLYALGQLTGNGHTKRYIEKHKNRIADFARTNPDVSEQGTEPDWYDGRVVALMGLLWCSDGEKDGENIRFPRAQCPDEVQSLFPEGNVLERLKAYARPCCVVSGVPDDTSDKVRIFPCQLQSSS